MNRSIRSAVAVTLLIVAGGLLLSCGQVLPWFPIEGELESQPQPVAVTTLTNMSGTKTFDPSFGLVLAVGVLEGKPAFVVDDPSRGLFMQRDPLGAHPSTTPINVYAPDFFALHAALVDLDGDGDDDLVVAGDELDVLRNDDGDFVDAFPTKAVCCAGITGARAQAPIAVADVDGDGLPDVLVAPGEDGDDVPVLSLKNGVATVTRRQVRFDVGEVGYCSIGFSVVRGALLMLGEACGPAHSTQIGGGAGGPDRLFHLDTATLASLTQVDLGTRGAATVFGHGDVVDVGMGPRSTVEASFDGVSFGEVTTVLGTVAWGFADLNGDGHGGFVVQGEADGAELSLPQPPFNVIVADIDGDGADDVIASEVQE